MFFRRYGGSNCHTFAEIRVRTGVEAFEHVNVSEIFYVVSAPGKNYRRHQLLQQKRIARHA